MIRIFTLATFLLACPALAEVQGIFDLVPTDYDGWTMELAKPQVVGISYRARWKTIETKDQTYDWALIDKAIKAARDRGKKAVIKVTPGLNTPKWAYENYSGMEWVWAVWGVKKCPVPWDEVYLSLWCRFIATLGQRYDGNLTVTLIQMAGVSQAGEMDIPDGLPLDEEAYLAAWQRVIDAYVAAFPSRPLALSVHSVAGRLDVVQAVVEYCLWRYPGKVLIQANDLKSVGSEYSAIIRAAGAYTDTGYQMFGGREWRDAETGDRLSAFQKAVADGVDYIEVYQGDLRDSALADELSYLAGAFQGD